MGFYMLQLSTQEMQNTRAVYTLSVVLLVVLLVCTKYGVINAADSIRAVV